MYKQPGTLTWNDRYKETTYIDEKRQLALKENNAYTLLDTNGIPSDNQVDTVWIQNVR